MPVLARCGHCLLIFNTRDLIAVGHAVLCSQCHQDLSNTMVNCSECRTSHPRSEMTRVEGHGEICPECIQDGTFVVCGNCSALVHGLQTTEYEGDDICPSCAQMLGVNSENRSLEEEFFGRILCL